MPKFTRNQQIAGIALLIIILFFTGYFIYNKSMVSDSPDLEQNVAKKETNSTLKDDSTDVLSKPKKDLKIYITGLVKAPGVYTMREGDRIEDAIKLAGGTLDGADLSNVNLAEKVKDEEMIKIIKIGENVNQNSNTSGTTTNSSNFENKSNGGKININKATKEELDTLPGIGQVTAQRIIDFREQHGGFQKIEDIMNVSRIGPKLFEQIKDKISVD